MLSLLVNTTLKICCLVSVNNVFSKEMSDMLSKETIHTKHTKLYKITNKEERCGNKHL